jgi:hypothetical protein
LARTTDGGATGCTPNDEHVAPIDQQAVPDDRGDQSGRDEGQPEVERLSGRDS